MKPRVRLARAVPWCVRPHVRAHGPLSPHSAGTNGSHGVLKAGEVPVVRAGAATLVAESRHASPAGVPWAVTPPETFTRAV